MGPVAKLTLRPKDGGTALELPYNPTSLQVKAQARYASVPNQDGSHSRQYLGGTTRSLSVQVRLDVRAMRVSVWETVQQLFSWLQPTEATEAQHAPMPPLLALSWGKEWFDVCLTGASARYVMFDADGTPTRAEADIDLEEVDVAVPRQNPTSGSLVGRRSHQVVAGDSLHSIATAQYGDPSRWRDLAVVNDLDDPMALRPGSRLLLPDLADLLEMEQWP